MCTYLLGKIHFSPNKVQKSHQQLLYSRRIRLPVSAQETHIITAENKLRTTQFDSWHHTENRKGSIRQFRSYWGSWRQNSTVRYRLKIKSTGKNTHNDYARIGGNTHTTTMLGFGDRTPVCEPLNVYFHQTRRDDHQKHAMTVHSRRMKTPKSWTINSESQTCKSCNDRPCW